MKGHGINIMPNSAVLANIVKAALKKKTVVITYRDSKGNVSERETEPYDIKGDKYWGYCKSKSNIRQFSLLSVSAARVTANTYIPRWEVKIK